MRRIIVIIICVCSFNAQSQYELSSFSTTGRGGATTFVTDYQALGINPANLGWTNKFEGKTVALGFNEAAYSFHSEALSKQDLREEFRNIIRNRTATDFTREEKLSAAKSFANEGLAFNADYGSFGFAVTTDKLGGIGFRINDRFQWYSRIGPQASELLFLGKTAPYFDSLTIVQEVAGLADTSVIANDPSAYDYDTLDILNGFNPFPGLISDLLDGSRLSMHWYREYNLSYGRKLFQKDSLFALYGGIGIKYLQGLGVMDINANDGDFEAFSAITPFFDIDYGNAANFNPSTVQQTGVFPNAVGQGWGFDLGLNVVLFNKLKIGASYVNGGSITYTGNVYSIKDTLVLSTTTAGLDNYNVFNSIKEFTGEDGLLQWDGESERKVKLPSMIRFGASMEFGKVAQLGIDILVPGNDAPGNLEKVMIGFGGDIRVLRWLTFQAGFVSGGNYSFQVPLGILIGPKSGAFEMGIASRDALTFITQNGSTVSLAFGFTRFRF